jgi:porin
MLKKLLILPLLCSAPLNAFAEETLPYTWVNTLTLESLSNLHGGVATGTRNLANLDLTLSVDTTSAGWWDDGTLFVYVLGNYGRPPSELTGELQTLSNIEADNNLKFYEFWYQHSFADGAVKLLVGLHDYNSTFYTLESASLFSLSSLGIGPDVSQVTPSIFPTTATAIHLTLSHKDQYFLLATYDGIPGDPAHPHGTHIKFSHDDGLLTAAEWGFAHEKNYKIAVGGWRHTAKVENPVNGSLSDSNSGYYLMGEKYFSEHWTAFFQHGHADGKKNQLETYTGLGVTYKNLWVDYDAMGLGYARAENSPEFLVANPDLLSAETVVEFTYYHPFTKKTSVQASLYSVEHPSMSPDVNNSLALGLRLYVEF